MKKSVWVVDDDPGISEVVQIILEEAGYEAKALCDGNELLAELQASQPDLILLDILMSGTDGREVARQLKDNDKTKHIPIILMSADTHVEDKCKEAGSDDCIKKPFDIHDLEQVIAKHIKTVN